MRKKVINKLLAGVLCVAMLITNQEMSCVVAMPEDGQEVYSDVDTADVLEENQELDLKESDRILEELETGDEGIASYNNGWEQEKYTIFSLEKAKSEAGTEIITEKESKNASYTLKYMVNDDGTATITGYSGTCSGNLVIPDKINGRTVTTIGSFAFSDCSGFTGDLIIPDSVTTIGHYAFHNCSGFTGDLTIPDSVTTIGHYAFHRCSGFTGSLTISENVTTIEERAFSECKGFTGSLTLPSKTVEIGSYAFGFSSGFTGNLTIPDSVTTIEAHAFTGCSGFTGSLKIPPNITKINEGVFSSCSGLCGNLVIPENVMEIGMAAFYECSGFTGNLIISKKATVIGDSAFLGCSGLDGDVIIPKSVKKIGISSFYGCKKLSSIRFLNPNCTIYFDQDTIAPNIKIYGYEGSTAKSYAASYRRTFVLLGTAEQIRIELLKATKNRTKYTAGDTLNTDDLTVIAQYMDGSSKAVTDFTTNASSLDMSTAGQKILTVTYVENDITVKASIKINVIEKLHSLEAVKTRTEYTVGDTLNTDDLTVTAQYTDGSSKEVTGFTTNASSLDMSTAGQKILTVTYVENGVTVEASIEIHVKEKSGSTSDILSYEVKDGTAVIIGSEGNASGELVIPETVGGYKITEIGDGAFEGGNGFTGNLVIPNGVTTIGDRAFSGCSGLTGNVIIPESVTKVGIDAFKGCSGISSIQFLNPECQIDGAEGTIPEGAIIYGYDNSTAEEYAKKYGRPFISLGTSGGGENPPEQTQVKSLEAVKARTEYTVGDTLNTDDLTVTAEYTDGSSKAVTGFTTNASSLDMSTAGQKTLTVTYVENGVTVEASIEIHVKEKSGSTSDILSYEVKDGTAVIIGSEENASGELVIPETVGGYKVTEIGDGAFEVGNGFTGNLVIPNGVTTIGDRAFSGCSGLTGNVIIPESVTKVGTDAFKGCSGISSIQFLNPECQIDGAEGTISEGAIIYGYDNSTAEEYAKKYGRTFISLGTSGGGENPPEQTQVKSLEAVKTKTEYTVGDTLNMDDLIVTAQYTDGSSKAVTGFTTNASSLDMSTAGQKTLTVTYVENSVTVEASIEINVKETVVVIEDCMVTFDANGGVDLSEASRTVGKGGILGKLPSVKRDGYVFKGWYTGKEDGQEVTEGTIITEDTILYARWEEDSAKPGEPDNPIQPMYKVIFYLKGKDGSLDEYTCYTDISSGGMIEAPSAPEIEGYQFTGWYKDEKCTVLWDFDTDVVTENTILYAGWKQKDLEDENLSGILPEDVPTDGKIPDGIWIAGVEEYVYSGEAVTPQVRVYNHDRRLVKGRDYTVSYKNNKKAAEASAKKSPRIIVKGKGNYTGKVSQTFTIKKAELTEACLVAASNYFAGNTYVPAVMLDGNILKAKTDYTLTYQNADGKKLKKCPVTEGSYSMRIIGKGSCTGEFIFPYTITKDGRISIAKGKATVSTIIYGDKEPVTSLIVNGETLKNGTDYIVKFNNIGKKGTATATFTGIEKYTGVLKKTFKVKATPLPIGCVSVDSSAVSYEKGGAKPDVTVTVDGTKLNEGIDYIVAYKGNTKIGSMAQVEVKGKGNYSGVQNASFSVTQKDLAAEDVRIYVSDVVTGGKKPAVMIYDANEKKLSLGSDYKTEVDMAAHKVTVTGGSNKLYIASTPIIREYRELNTGKIITSVSLNKKASNFPGKFQYAVDGVELDQSWLTVKAGKNILSADDFKVIGYIDNTSKGTATVIIQGNGEYGGIKALNFKIQSKSILSIFNKAK